ncbi:MAG: glycosyltransferase family 39 protein [Thermomicrobiales bacterium]
MDASRLPYVLVTAVLLAALGQWVLSSRAEPVGLPPQVMVHLAPMWPATASAVAAIALFLLAMPLYGYAVGRLANGDRWASFGVSAPARSRTDGTVGTAVFLGVIGLAIIAGISLLLSTGAYYPSYPRWYALGLTLVVAAFAWHERERFREWSRLFRARWRRLLPEIAAVVALLAVFVFLGTFDLDDWRYASIGDEGTFFYVARSFATGGEQGRNLFSQDGVYGYHPVLGTYVVGQLMRVFGTDGVGWKTATLVPVAVALALGYLLARAWYGRRTALVFLGLAVTAHYLLAFTHTGYNNLDSLLFSIGAMLFFTLGLRQASPLFLVLSGIAAGFGWYTFYSSRTVIVLLAAAVVLTVRPRRWVQTSTMIGIGFLAVIIPLFAVNRSEVIGQMLRQSGGGDRGKAGDNNDVLLLWNAGRSLLAFNYNTKHYLYTSGSLVEPVTAVLFVLGLGLCLMTFSDARSRLLVAWFGLGITITGILSPYDHVTVTRLHYVLPVVLLFAALAVDRTLKAWPVRRPTRVSRTVMTILVVGVILGAGASNLNRWLVVSREESPTSPNTVSIRVLRDDRCQDAPLPTLILDWRGDGAMEAAVEQVGGLTPPEFITFEDPKLWLQTVDARCVILRSSDIREAQVIQAVIAARWPDLRPVRETDGSGQVNILAYYPDVDPSATPVTDPEPPGTPER